MKKIFALMAVLVLTLVACSDDIEQGTPRNPEVQTYKIAVFAKPEQREWMAETIDWAQSILTRAQEGQPRAVALDFEWMDATTDNMPAALARIADGDYAAVLGPSESEAAQTLLSSSVLSGRTVILPTVGSAELQRIYAEWDNVFFLTQSDVMQNEVLLNLAKESFSTDRLALVTSDDGYGETFREWFGFQAEEMNSEVTSVALLGKDLTVREAVEAYRQRHKDAYLGGSAVDSEELTFFFPSSSADLLELDRVLTEMDDTPWESYVDSRYWATYTACSDRCVDYSIASEVQHTFFGVEPAPLPGSGFAAVYETKYGHYPLNGTAQVFDAVYLLTYALSAMDAKGESDVYELWKSVVEVLDGAEACHAGWQAADAEQIIGLLRQGQHPDINGVSSDWEFDERFHCAPLSTTYRLWQLRDGQYGTISYISANGKDGSLSNFDIWNLEKPKITDICDADDILYPALKDNYAIVVAASTGWSNYRHQADALAMYQLLKRHGYDDDHIILIMEDDIAQNENNVRKGEVRVQVDGDNLYHDLQIDYRLTDLTYDDLINIVSGQRSAKLPVVLPSTAEDNVLFFWSGHGNSGTLYMNETKFPAADVSRMLKTMNSERKYRRLFFVIEACYAGSVATVCEGIPGVLFLTAANTSETSKADIVDKELKTYLSNGFTRGFQQRIDTEPDVTLRDLYYHVAAQTVGSHARMYNIPAFGSVYKTRMDEFLKK